MYSLLNPDLLDTLEKNAMLCARNLDNMLSTLQNNMKDVTSLSVQYVESYKISVNNVGDEINKSVIAMNNLITKCQELNEDMRPVEQLFSQMYPLLLFY